MEGTSKTKRLQNDKWISEKVLSSEIPSKGNKKIKMELHQRNREIEEEQSLETPGESTRRNEKC